MTTTQTTPRHFTKLVNRARTIGIERTDPPRPIGEIGRVLGVSRQTIYNLLDGKHTPRPFIRERLARGLAKLLSMPLDEVRRHVESDWRETF